MHQAPVVVVDELPQTPEDDLMRSARATCGRWTS